MVDEAIKRRSGKEGEGYDDNKLFVTVNGIESLIGANANVIFLNTKSGQGNYVHEVVYEGHRFISCTNGPFSFKFCSPFGQIKSEEDIK